MYPDYAKAITGIVCCCCQSAALTLPKQITATELEHDVVQTWPLNADRCHAVVGNSEPGTEIMEKVVCAATVSLTN